ncbi:hypothetical protein DUI87_18083 [Hirundo rustica rustica]|uniref:Uncharacterized protein n=1 Tax=Hirundo rustica rustica TaxID=333673 RepID=A0A3M0JVP6_HIRRU|nr:hypothetical protein DUI87_18083 [Hirundo rustica rustica]
MQHHSPPLSGPGHAAIPNPAQSAPAQATDFQEYAVGDSAKSLAEIQIENIHSPPCIHQVGHLVIKGDQSTSDISVIKPVGLGAPPGRPSDLSLASMVSVFRFGTLVQLTYLFSCQDL